MGTTWSVRLVAPPSTDLRTLHRGIESRLAQVVSQMSNWEHDSDISRFNRAAPDSWHLLATDFDHVLRCAQEIAADSNGAFDPTLGALVSAWGFGPEATSHATVEQLHRQSGFHRLQRRDDGHWLQPGDMQLDLCAIAKGFAVDAVSDWLRGNGITAALTEVGGELHGYGRKPDDSPWRVIIEGWAGDARDDAPARIVELDGIAVATSGERWHQRHDAAGQRYSHTLDPRSGEPLRNGVTAVTVVSESAMRADGWATALGVLGIEAGYDLACRHEIAARFIGNAEDGHRERMTPAFIALTTH